MSTALPIIELLRVSKEYAAPGGGPGVAVLREVSLQVRRGESLAVVGPSGSGKSTLLHILGTLDHATHGEVRFDGRETGGLAEPELARLRNRHIGFVFQSHFLLPQCTVLENVLMPTLAVPQADAPATRKRAETLLDRLGLAPRLAHRPAELSGGEKQRVAVARALINQPELLLADEPTGSLDQGSAAELGALLSEVNREQGVALVVVTHSLELAQRMGRVLKLSGGQLVAA